MCDCSEFQLWSDVYFTNLFTTLGQLSAVLISGTVAVPMLSYYSKSLTKFFLKQSKMSVDVKTEDEELNKKFKSN